MYTKVLVANRGEIALRIVRTLHEMGIIAVAVYSDADRHARHVLEADEAYRIGPPPAVESYLNGDEIIRMARQSAAGAIHPGYGFLAENAEFARAVCSAGIEWVGPEAATISRMGDKVEARRIAQAAGVPVVPGTLEPVGSLPDALAFTQEHGYPVAVKAAGGGGGRGIRIVRAHDEMAGALERAAHEANAYFKNPLVYIERYFPNPRHIEVQVVGDRHGAVVAWGERDCSTQRRHQKLIEETPAPNLPEEDRRRLLSLAEACARAVGYVGVGTVEFLYTGSGEIWFLEMNTRIQVEHPVTEEVTGLDLVAESLRVSAGEPLSIPPTPRGHAIEVRINAEDPGRSFLASPGQITRYREPGGPGVRVDSGVYEGFTVPGDYDSLVAKLIVHGPDREAARLRLLRALKEYHIDGISTTIGLQTGIVATPAFADGRMTTAWLDDHIEDVLPASQPAPTERPVASMDAARYEVEVNGRRFAVRVTSSPSQMTDRDSSPNKRNSGRVRRATLATGSDAPSGSIVSPMHGTVVAVAKDSGDVVSQGECVFVIEAMKMENDVPAPFSGTVGVLSVGVGDTVDVGQTLATLVPTPGTHIVDKPT